MIDEIQKLLDDYIIWLKDKTLIRQVNNWIEITTPYIDRHNDYVQIYSKKQNNDYILTDDGYVIDDLMQSGCDLESKKRKDLLQLTLNGFGVKLEDNNLLVRATSENFALRKHNLIQAMLAVNDLFYLAVPMVKSLFLEDVTAWLELNDIRYTPRVKFTGKSGYDHLYDFVIPASKKKPERILKVINRPNRNTAETAAFSWLDTKEVRPPHSKAFTILNDIENIPSESVIDALRTYDINPILWSERENVKEELAA
jgi:hypothetical protein